MELDPEVSNTLLTAKCQIQEVAGSPHKHPFAPFPPPFFQPQHIGLSGLVFRGACGLKGQPKHLTSAVWIAHLGLCSSRAICQKIKSSSRPAPLQGKGTLGFKIKGWGNTDLFSEPSHVCSTFTTDSFPFNTIS